MARTGEDAEQIWREVPAAVANEKVEISGGKPAPVEVLRESQSLWTAFVALILPGMAGVLCFTLLTTVPLPRVLGWFDATVNLPVLPAFSVRGITAVLATLPVIGSVFRIHFPVALDDADAEPPPPSPIPPDTTAASALAPDFADVQRDTIVAYVLFGWIGFQTLQRKNRADLAALIPHVVESLGHGDPKRISVDALARRLHSIDAPQLTRAQILNDFLTAHGLRARAWN